MGSPLNPGSPIAISGLPLLGVSSQTDFRSRRPARRDLFLFERLTSERLMPKANDTVHLRFTLKAARSGRRMQ